MSSLGRRPRAPPRESYPPSRLRRGQSPREHHSSRFVELEPPPEPPDLTDLLTPPPLEPYARPGPYPYRRSSPFPSIDAFLAQDMLDNQEEDEEVRRRLKRRKLDHEEDKPSYPSVGYGHFGQVVAGPLKMEIVSCDGGHFKSLYRAENMLRNDKSVYCSESSRCNLMLRHQGETLFSLERIIIKAPDLGFTAPYVLHGYT
jgi:hypothetical protein